VNNILYSLLTINYCITDLRSAARSSQLIATFACMNIRTRKVIFKILGGLIILYVAGGILLFFLQGYLLFHPAPLPLQHRFAFGEPFEDVNIPFEKSNLNIVEFDPALKRKGIVLFFHGNSENVEHYARYPSVFLNNGYSVWMIDYPGFGKTTGERSEQILYRQAKLMYQMAVHEIRPDSIIIYGKSIGTGIASWLASVTKCRRLILETPYYSIDALARDYFPMYPVVPMTKYSFPVYKYLSHLHFPVTIFHGTSDEVVAYNHSLSLKKENPSIELITIKDGKHNDLFGFDIYQEKMDSLLRN
jgi:pimeloyl-ACP methyl ester carboxylesterase